MPLFEYRCERCAHLEEVLQKHTDPAPETCPACGAAGTMAKAISLTSFQLKGGGWYKDLYSSSSTTKSEGGDAKGSTGAGTDAASTAKTSDGKPADSKPASKPADSKPADSKPADSKPAKAASTTGASTASA